PRSRPSPVSPSFPTRRSSDLIYAAAKLGLADVLSNGRLARSEELAYEIGADAQALRRVLRGMVLVGILFEDGVGRFGLTGMGELDRKSTRLNSSHSQISYAVF